MKVKTKKQQATCEACHSPSDNLQPDRRAKHLGIGAKLCPHCLAFISEVSDDDYVWTVKHLCD